METSHSTAKFIQTLTILKGFTNSIYVSQHKALFKIYRTFIQSKSKFGFADDVHVHPSSIRRFITQLYSYS